MQRKTEAEKKLVKDYKKLAQLLEDGMPITKSLEMAGWSPWQARKGRCKIPAEVKKMLSPKAKRLMEKGKMNPQDLRNLVVGRLVENTTEGKDAGTQSAKTLGQLRDLNLWQPEELTGVLVISAPRELLERKEEMLRGTTGETVKLP